MIMLLDSSAVIQLVERRQASIVDVLRTATEQPVISVVTLGELAVGLSTLPSESLRRRTYRAARRLRIVDIESDPLMQDPTGVIASFGECRAVGIKGNDAWIAATAMVMSAMLLTYDATLAERYGAVGSVTLLAAAPTN